MVSLKDLYRLSDSGPVVSSIGTTRVGTVPFMLILKPTLVPLNLLHTSSGEQSELT